MNKIKKVPRGIQEGKTSRKDTPNSRNLVSTIGTFMQVPKGGGGGIRCPEEKAFSAPWEPLVIRRRSSSNTKYLYRQLPFLKMKAFRIILVSLFFNF